MRQDYSQTFEDIWGLTWTAKRPRECRGLSWNVAEFSRTVLVRESLRSDCRGLSRKGILACFWIIYNLFCGMKLQSNCLHDVSRNYFYFWSYKWLQPSCFCPSYITVSVREKGQFIYDVNDRVSGVGQADANVLNN